MSQDNDAKKKRTPALYKMADILDLVAKENKVTFTKIYSTLNMAKSSTYALVMTMVELGFLTANTDSTLSLGSKLYELGGKVSSNLEITQVAWPYLNKIRDETSLTTHLGIINGSDAFYLMKLDGYSTLIPNSWVGKKLSLHSSSLGKVLMAWKHDIEISQIMSNYTFEKKTEKTIDSYNKYPEELGRVKKQYYATDIGEDVDSIICIAVPVFNYTNSVIAGLSITSLQPQFNEDEQQKTIKVLKENAFELSKKLGYTGEYHGL